MNALEIVASVANLVVAYAASRKAANMMIWITVVQIILFLNIRRAQTED